MERRMLTVINSNGAITEVDLDKYNKKNFALDVMEASAIL